ncbi:TRAFAC clade GTPase domain-containing protein [Streptomyces cinereoruber]|uniref:TRAFAC clade GTPase domain-containing protein n=1 Tax=Streptomyces cinereoruber TaxID=67260 RepID=UPI003661448C
MTGDELTRTVVVALLAFWGVTGFLVCCAYAFWKFLGTACRSAAQALGPFRAGQSDPRVLTIGTEPAHPSYWPGQSWIDTTGAVGRSYRALWTRWRAHWMLTVAARLFRGRRPGTNRRGKNKLTRQTMRLVAPGTAVGATVAALHTAVLVVFCAFVALPWASWVLTVAVVRGAERGWLLLRRVRTVCPHPACHRPFPLAAHPCPQCRAVHTSLVPGRYGVFRHACRCGARLPSSLFAGRADVPAECPSCARPLPPSAGTTRVVHVPLIGASSSGKTMLVAAVVAGLRSWAERGNLTVEFASDADQQDGEALDREIDRNDWARKTQGDQRAWMIVVGKGRRRRLLYLYDPMGESLHRAGGVREQQYLAHADGVLLVVDVLADRTVRQSLSGADETLADGARPAARGPVDTYQGLTGELVSLTGGRGELPAAVVVTKRDVLDRIESLPAAGARVDEWLGDIGLGGLVRGVAHDFGAAGFWAVSASAATGHGALDSERRRAAEPVLWLLARTGLRVGDLVESRGRIPRQGGRTGTSRGGTSRIGASRIGVGRSSTKGQGVRRG